MGFSRFRTTLLGALPAVVLMPALMIAPNSNAAEKADGTRAPAVTALPISDLAEKTETMLQSLPPSPALLEGTSADEAVRDQFVAAREAPAIDFAILPGQAAGHKLWSNWGDALYGSDGMFYGSIGDHDGPFGSALVYRVNPKSKEIKLVVDVNKVMSVPTGTYTGGKIHCPLVDDGRGHLYFATYRGSVQGASEEYGYRGDHFFCYDQHSGRTEDLGPLVPNMTIPVLVYYAPTETLYGEGMPAPAVAAETGNVFFAYSLKEKRFGYHLGGTFGTALSPDGSELFIVWNGDMVGASKQPDFGLCSAMIVHIPAVERSVGRE